MLELNKDVKVYIKESAKGEFYYKVLFIKKNIGEKKGLFEKYSDRFVFIDRELALSDSLKLLSNEVYDTNYTCKDKNLM